MYAQHRRRSWSCSRRSSTGRDVTVHFGWPTSSWLDRMATGRVRRQPDAAAAAAIPQLHFAIECAARQSRRSPRRRARRRPPGRASRSLDPSQKIDREPRDQVALDVLGEDVPAALEHVPLDVARSETAAEQREVRHRRRRGRRGRAAAAPAASPGEARAARRRAAARSDISAGSGNDVVAPAARTRGRVGDVARRPSARRRSAAAPAAASAASAGAPRRRSRRRSGVPQQTTAATSRGRRAARRSVSSAPSETPATTVRGVSARRAASASSADASQSRQSVRARSAGVVPWPGRRTARTGKPAAASASPSGRTSSGVAVNPCSRRQPSGRGPPRAKPSTPAAASTLGDDVGLDLERALLPRALLQVIHEGLHGVLLLLLQQGGPEACPSRRPGRQDRRRCAPSAPSPPRRCPRRRPSCRAGDPCVSEKASFRRSAAAPSFGTTPARRSKGPVSSTLRPCSAAALSSPISFARASSFSACSLARASPRACLASVDRTRAELGDGRQLRIDPLDRLEQIDGVVRSRSGRSAGSVRARTPHRRTPSRGRRRESRRWRRTAGVSFKRLPATSARLLPCTTSRRSDSACLRASSRPFSAVSVFTISSRTASSGFCAAGELLLDLDDVEAEGRLDDVAHRARLERERGGIERRHHVPAREEPEVAALAGGSGVLGDVLRELGEVGALLHLGEDVLGLRACGGARLLVGGGRQP